MSNCLLKLNMENHKSKRQTEPLQHYSSLTYTNVHLSFARGEKDSFVFVHKSMYEGFSNTQITFSPSLFVSLSDASFCLIHLTNTLQAHFHPDIERKNVSSLFSICGQGKSVVGTRKLFALSHLILDPDRCICD